MRSDYETHSNYSKPPMLRNVTWSAERSYRTGTEYEPLQFYFEGLCNSNQLNLLLGYFSSAAINVLALGFASFLYNGGKVRMVVNNILSEQDKEAIKAARDGNIDKNLLDLSDIKQLKRKLDEYGNHFFECLAWLIAHDKIQIIIIRPKVGNGIAHYKSGSFSDGTDTVGFKASCNFTAYGLLENLEELDVHLSWEDNSSSKRINSQNQVFSSIFSGDADFAEHLNVEDISVAIKDEFGGKTENELIIQEKELLEKKLDRLNNRHIRETYEKVIAHIEDIIREPRFPYSSGPRPYQIEAYQNWVANDYKGIFAMATGTGKTITSLNCILQEYKKNSYYRFIVLVPTISLATQWEKEMTVKFNFEEVTICSSQNNKWEDSVRDYVRNLRLGISSNFCILITYSSYRMKRFQNIIKEIPDELMKSITLIADEAHTFGSKNLLKVLPHNISKRIGLSATPERQYDEIGENEISDFFNAYPPYYTFRYDMKKAIEDGVLCRYNYYPKLVELESDELMAYRIKTIELTKFLDPTTGRYKDEPYVNNLLIQRKNIIHKARNKSNCLTDIIDEIGKGNFKHAFIYVPEGYEPNYEESDIEVQTDIEEIDDRIIDNYTNLLYENYKLRLRKFTGETSDREEILNQFSSGKLNALLAMKCLDEGVDIPQTKIAVFCSSTGNPRQYIQRRGRVLRAYGKDKVAIVYDMIVKPFLDVTNTDERQVKMEKNILTSELRRLVNFAVLAENKDECLRSMETLCYDLDIDIYELANDEENSYNT